MYITINNIKGESRIDLSYSIQNFDSDKEITVIRMLSDNVKYEILKVRAVMDPISDTKKMLPNGTYASRELISMLEGIIELNQIEIDDQVTKTNKLKGITEITLNLDELNNSDNLTLFWTGPGTPYIGREGAKKPPQVNSAIWCLTTMKLGRSTV